MRDLGASTGSYFVEVGQTQTAKGRPKLEDALRDVTLDETQSVGGESIASSSASSMLDADILPSQFVQRRTYQDQQNIPDALGGFQPDMDPRLREVLEALEDEAYVDDEDDFFAELAQDRVEVEPEAWTSEQWPDDDGWETDDTVKGQDKGVDKTQAKPDSAAPQAKPDDNEQLQEAGNHDWTREYAKFKAAKRHSALPAQKAAGLDSQSSIVTGGTSLIEGRRKKRKGALTSSTGYSMTSSSLFRTEGLTTLDDRFAKIEEQYADAECDDVDDAASMVSGVSGVSTSSRLTGVSNASSRVPQLTAGLDSVMDEFLENYSMVGRRRVRKGKQQSGMEQLDEIRKDLGPARISLQRA